MPPRRSQRSKRPSAQALEALVSSPPQRVRRQSLGLDGSASSSTHQPSILHESLAAQPGSRAATWSPVQSQSPPAAPATDQLAALTSPVTDQLVSRVTDEVTKRLQPFLSNLRTIVHQAQSPTSTSSPAPPVSLSVDQSTSSQPSGHNIQRVQGHAAIQDTVEVPAVHDGVQSVLASLSGWEMGIKGMCLGEKRKLITPPHPGYGARGIQNVIPSNSVLIFTTKLMSIKRKSPFDPKLLLQIGYWAVLAGMILYYLYRKASKESDKPETKSSKKNKSK